MDPLQTPGTEMQDYVRSLVVRMQPWQQLVFVLGAELAGNRRIENLLTTPPCSEMHEQVLVSTRMFLESVSATVLAWLGVDTRAIASR